MCGLCWILLCTNTCDASLCVTHAANKIKNDDERDGDDDDGDYYDDDGDDGRDVCV